LPLGQHSAMLAPMVSLLNRKVKRLILAFAFCLLISAKAGDFPTGTTLWLTERVAVVTKTGVIGILPGTKVTVIRINGDKLILNDGSQDFEALRSQVTDKPETAERAARNDAATQVAIEEKSSGQKGAVTESADRRNSTKRGERGSEKAATHFWHS
jgi:hypothetical protein